MASSPKAKVTFASLPREIRDKVYKNMLTESKFFDISERATDYGQPDDVETLRATHRACRRSPRFAREAFEVYFGIKTFIIWANYDLRFLHRPIYFVENQGFTTLRMFVQAFEVRLHIRGSGPPVEHQVLGKCFRDLLSCPDLRHVTVKVELAWVGRGVAQERDSADLEIILAAARAVHQELKARLGRRLKFETKYPLLAETIKAWEERNGESAVKET